VGSVSRGGCGGRLWGTERPVA